MVRFPLCKINLGLHVVAIRADGYHEIETCFYPVPWTDVLEVIPFGTETFSYSGLPIPGLEQENLCALAYALLKTEFDLPPVALHLHKIIPLGAGLGGGSADAAFVLTALRDLFTLPVSPAELEAVAASLGSDCTFFLNPAPTLARGRGEVVKPVAVDLGGKFLTIVVPPIHIPTKMAYAGVSPRVPAKPLEEILGQPASAWKELMVNDFESTIFEKYPAIARIKELLYSAGALYASMSGSGSSVFGIFDSPFEPASAFPGMQTWTGKLS